MRCTKDFRPARGVTLENSLRHLVAVEMAVIRDTQEMEPSERRFALRLIRTAVKMLLRTLDALIGQKDGPETEGELFAMLHPSKPEEPN